jgi:hypothetical protein
VSFGVSPICDSRSIAEHPLATLPSSSSAPLNARRLQREWLADFARDCELEVERDFELDFELDLDMNLTRVL